MAAPDGEMAVGLGVICRDVYHDTCDKYPTEPKPFLQTRISNGLSERYMTLKHRSIGAPAMFPLSAALTNNLRVQKLDLDGADIKDEGVIYLAKALVDNITVSHMNLSNNNIEEGGIQWVAYLLTKNKFLKYLNLSGNKIRNISAYDIAAALEANQCLTHLDLSHNELGEEGITLIASALVNNACLKIFNVSWNQIRGQGAVSLSQCLKFNDSLLVLDVSWNGFAYEGALALSKSLKENQTLRELNLSNNRINWNGALLLSKGLKINTGLHVLRIGNNPLTTTGCHDIVHAIATGSSAIKTLDMTSVPIVAETDILASFIRMKRDFRMMHGGIVYLPDVLGERKERALNHMEVVMQHMKDRFTRPLEMLRNFDKSANILITEDEFVQRLVKAGVPLHKFEMRMLAGAVSESNKGLQSKTGSIDYKKLLEKISEQILGNRVRQYREETTKKKTRSYHKRILETGLTKNGGISRTFSTDVLLGTSSEATMSPMLGRKISPFGQSMTQFTPDSTGTGTSRWSILSQESKFLKPLKPKPKGCVFSMSAPLEDIGLKKKKKKTPKKKNKKRKAITPMRTLVSEL